MQKRSQNNGSSSPVLFSLWWEKEEILRESMQAWSLSAVSAFKTSPDSHHWSMLAYSLLLLKMSPFQVGKWHQKASSEANAVAQIANYSILRAVLSVTGYLRCSSDLAVSYFRGKAFNFHPHLRNVIRSDSSWLHLACSLAKQNPSSWNSACEVYHRSCF